MSLCRFCFCFVFMSASLTIGLCLCLTMCDWEWIMGSKNVCTVCVGVYIICLQPTQCYMHTCIIFVCVGGQWVCMWLHVCDCRCERERERSHWYCAVTLLHYHDYVFTLLCIECFIYDSWYWWWDNFPSFFPPFISEAVACIQKAIEIYTDMVRKNTLSLLQTPTLAFWHSSSKLCYSWLC